MFFETIHVLVLFFLIVTGFSDEMLELLVFALQDLKKLLKDQGSDLLIGFGSAEDVIVKLVNEVAWQGFFPSSDFHIMYMYVT